MKNVIHISKIIFTILVLFLFFSCKKNDIQNQDLPNQFKHKMIEWIGNKVKEDPLNASKIEELEKNLNYSAIYEDTSRGNEKLLIVPISEEYKKYRKIKINVLANLVVILNQFGQIRKAYVISYTEENNHQKIYLPSNTFYNLIYTGKKIIDGKFVICNITGSRIYEVKYIDGLLREQGLVQTKNQNEIEKKIYPLRSSSTNSASQVLNLPNNINSTSTGCFELWLETTYYDSNGNITDFTEQYLGTYGNCSNNSDQASPNENGGGTSSGDSEADPEFDRYSTKFIDIKASGTSSDAPIVRGSADFHGSWGQFNAVSMHSMIPTHIVSTGWSYQETSKSADYVNLPSPVASVSFIGELNKDNNIFFPISASRTYTYAQAFNP